MLAGLPVFLVRRLSPAEGGGELGPSFLGRFPDCLIGFPVPRLAFVRGRPGPVPNGVRYTFRTTFDMTGFALASALIRGSILADDRVVAIRLNGRELLDPAELDQSPVDHLRFRIEGRELLAGVNVLEIEVLNGEHGSNSVKEGIVACAVPCEGWATRLP